MDLIPSLPRMAAGQTADIGLMLEGTYPFVSGGVSSWVHDIVSGFPELSFGIAFIGSAPDNYGPIRYKLPPNLVHLEAHYLVDGLSSPSSRTSSGKKDQFDKMARLHDQLRHPGRGRPDALLSALGAVETVGGISWRDFLYSDESWDQVCDSYRRFCTSPSFVDYFWTVRTMHAPLFKMARIAAGLPHFRVIHSVSTGYAGFLGALLQQRRGSPYVLTEHGIYTKERKIDLANADWIKDVREELASGLDEDTTYVRRLWARFFEGLGRLAYLAADPIVSLYQGNRQRQIADGAPEERTMVVPNGIDVERFAVARRPRGAPVPQVLGLIGRVVPIKDIRGFIQAMRGVVALLPRAEGWIIGPDDEDPDYARECRDLVSSLGLNDQVKFLGFKKPEEVFPQLGLTVLTSISEALPLVVLESFASGVPVVATDVGSCNELIAGRDPDDRARGQAGAVVPIADPGAVAAAAADLLLDSDRWMRCREVGLARVQALYSRPQMFDSYRAIYGAALECTHGGHRIRTS